MQLFIFSVSKTFYSVSIYISIRFLKNYIHFNWHKVNPIDDAIASRIELAFKEHQSTLNSVVNSAVRDAMDSVLIPALRGLREDIQATNESVKELREEFEAIATTAKQTRDRVDSVQAAVREDKRTVTDLKDQLERLTEKMTDMEDRCRRNNVRLVGLPEGMEGNDAAGFLRANLSKWILVMGRS